MKRLASGLLRFTILWNAVHKWRCAIRLSCLAQCLSRGKHQMLPSVFIITYNGANNHGQKPRELLPVKAQPRCHLLQRALLCYPFWFGLPWSLVLMTSFRARLTSLNRCKLLEDRRWSMPWFPSTTYSAKHTVGPSGIVWWFPSKRGV